MSEDVKLGRYRVRVSSTSFDVFDTQTEQTVASFAAFAREFHAGAQAEALCSRLEEQHQHRVLVQEARGLICDKVADLPEKDVLAAAAAIKTGEHYLTVFQQLFGFRAPVVGEQG